MRRTPPSVLLASGILLASCGGETLTSSTTTLTPANLEPADSSIPATGWTIQSTAGLGRIWSISAVDSDHAWVRTQEGLFRTVNGGQTWFQSASISVWLYPAAMQFVEPLHGWGVSYPRVISTSDGGETWSVRHMAVASAQYPTYGTFHFVTPDLGWVVTHGYFGPGTHLMKTTDGGTTWTALEFPVSGIVALRFLDTQTGWATTRTGPVARIFRTDDGGHSWQEQYSLNDVEFLDIAAVDADRVWMASSFSAFGTGKALLTSSDGGATWEWKTIAGVTGLSKVCFPDAATGWALGENVHHTTDGGATWTTLSMPNEAANQYSDMVFVNSTTGWVTGKTGPKFQDALILKKE